MMTMPVVPPSKMYDIASDKMVEMTDAEQRTYMQMSKLFNDNMSAYDVFNVMATWILIGRRTRNKEQ